MLHGKILLFLALLVLILFLSNVLLVYELQRREEAAGFEVCM